jgi:hypothetical protein
MNEFSISSHQPNKTKTSAVRIIFAYFIGLSWLKDANRAICATKAEAKTCPVTFL